MVCVGTSPMFTIIELKLDKIAWVADSSVLPSTSSWRCRSSIQHDAPRWNDLGKIVEIPVVSGKHTRTQLPRLQENQSVVDKPALEPSPFGKLLKRKSKPARTPACPEVAVRDMKYVLRYVLYRRLNCFQDPRR